MKVAPLEDAWRGAIDEVLAARGWPRLGEVARLGALVARLSDAYNETGAAARDLLPARLAFSFPRDTPKAAASVRELVDMGKLVCPKDRPLRVLDLGAGLGATTWGVARALEASGQRGEIEATWMDADAAALGVAMDLLAARARAGGDAAVKVRARTSAGIAPPRGQAYDLILLGQVMSELDRALAPPARIAQHATFVRALLDGSLDKAGSLVVIEPALRDRTRHLHAVRDRLLEAPGATVFAPCLHEGPCPALRGEGDWCHEDLPVDLPDWLAPVARAAGLRWQGLTFAYLVLRRDGASLRDRGFPWRVISSAIVTKGKRELFLCGTAGADGRPADRAADRESAIRIRVQRLDRHASDANRGWDDLGRGDLLQLSPPPVPSPDKAVGKVLPDTRIDVARTSE